MVVSKTDLRIDEQYIQVSMELKMLIAIVQEYPSHAEVLKSQLPIGESVLSNEDRSPPQGIGHEKGFIP